MSMEIAKTILDHIGDGILAVDSSLLVVFANSMACEILQVESSSIIGKHIDEVMQLTIISVEENNQPIKINPFLISISTGNMETYSKPMLVTSAKNGKVYIEDSVSPIFNSDRDVIGSVMTFRDVSEEVKLFEMLKVANQRYKTLFDSIKSGVAVYESKDGITFTIVDFNQAAEKIEDVNKSAILGKNIEHVFPGVIDLGLLSTLQKVWKTGNPERIPCALYKDKLKDGWRDNYVYKLPSGEVVTIYDDISDKRIKAEKMSEAVEKLRENENRLRGMFENSGVGMVVITDSSGFEIIQVNRAFCDFLGYTKLELIGKTIQSITPEEDWEKSLHHHSLVNSLPPVGGSTTFIKRYISKDGSIKWFSVFLTKIEHEDRRKEFFAQVVDITEKKRVEDERELLTQVVMELNAADVKNKDTIKNIMLKIKNFIGLDSVAVRLPEKFEDNNRVVDYPFYYHDGFDSDFINDEKYLNAGCCENQPFCLECFCGAVILGKTDKNQPFFTENGSFWTNNVSDFIKSKHDLDKTIYKPRKSCWERGYQSVAVIPISSSGKIVGSMLLNAYRAGAFSKNTIMFLEEIGEAMGVAFSRTQLINDIDEHRKALARANNILEVESDFARNIANESSENLKSVLTKAGEKLNIKWIGVAVVGESGIIERWTGENGASPYSEDIMFDSKTGYEIKQWASENKPYLGIRIEMPDCLKKISKNIEGFWMAIPILGDKKSNFIGMVILVSETQIRWSRAEIDAMKGFSTLLCILAKTEKNRIELKRKIEETILNISKSVSM